MKETRGPFGLILDLLASGTLADKLVNIAAHIGPVKIGLKAVQGFGKSHMASNRGGMKLLDEGRMKWVVWVQPNFVLEE